MTISIPRRLQWQPVRHACGHYEARLMAPTGALVNVAQSVCSTCEPQGRRVVPNFPDAVAADTACEALNARDGRDV